MVLSLFIMYMTYLGLDLGLGLERGIHILGCEYILLIQHSFFIFFS